MPDWKLLVCEKLGPLGANFREHEEIVSELTCHLEDVYEHRRAQGLSETEAVESALDELADGRKAGRRIQKSKEGPMNERTRKFWLPALASVAAACTLIAAVAQLSYLPRVILMRSEVATLVYPIWILGQLPLGALGAYFSRRAGGSRLTRLTAGLFPSVVMLAGIVVVIAVQTLLQGRFDFGSVDAGMFARAMVSVILIPTLALSLGVLPFLRDPVQAS